MKEPHMTKTTRRRFLQTSAAATAGAFSFHYVSARVLGKEGDQAPSSKLNIGKIGCGGMGGGDLGGVAGENIVALCDVDANILAGAAKKFPNAKTYKDWREMYDKEKLDAVVISTPDHTHAPPTAHAIRKGWHVRVQKPMVHTVEEARVILKLAKDNPKVVTQMGNQGNAGDGIRMTKEWIDAGAIGKVKEVHCWTDRPIWPQGMNRPDKTDPVPAHLDWDLWIGPAPMRPYVNGAYHPFKWRGWWDFGCGAIGDMAVHNMDPAFFALGLGYPASIEADAEGATAEAGPNKARITFEFPATDKHGPIKVVWFEKQKPPRPAALEEGKEWKAEGGNGILFFGDKGTILCGGWAGTPRLLPEAAMKDFKRPDPSIPRVKGGSYQEFIRACKGEGPEPGSNFKYACPFTETLLLGNAAVRAGKKLLWDGPNMKFTNDSDANKFLSKPYRKGWEL